jgi:hypothetical protein
MEGDRDQAISIRLPEETYERLKKYAEEHGKSVSELLRELIDGVLAGQPSPGPGSSPHPSPPVPQPGQVLPAEIAALPGKFQEMMNYEMQMRQYVGAMAVRMGELQKTVIGILAIMFPGAPPPPWALMSAVEPFPLAELEELAKSGEVEGKHT